MCPLCGGESLHTVGCPHGGDTGDVTAVEDIRSALPEVALAGELTSDLFTPTALPPLPVVPEHTAPGKVRLARGSDVRYGRCLNDRYVLGRQIGAGGYGAVFDAQDRRVEKRVAVKVLSPSLVHAPDGLTRFRQEAVAAGRIHHSAIVDVRDIDASEDGVHFIVMEYLEGRDLHKCIASDGPMDPARALAIAARCADGLSAAHQAGIFHRDLKPSNLYIPDRDEPWDLVKIIDFGVSKMFGNDVTDASGVLGTPFYMPPERIRTGEFDARSEVYALGVILYEMLVGSPPFTGTSTLEVCEAHLSTPPPRPSENNPALAPPPVCRVDGVVLRALQKHPDDRYPTMAAFAEALLDLLGVLDPALAVAIAPPRSGSTRVVSTSRRRLSTARMVAAPTQHVSPPVPRRRRHIARWAAAAVLAVGGAAAFAAMALPELGNTSAERGASSEATSDDDGTRTSPPPPRPSPHERGQGVATPTTRVEPSVSAGEVGPGTDASPAAPAESPAEVKPPRSRHRKRVRRKRRAAPTPAPRPAVAPEDGVRDW